MLECIVIATKNTGKIKEFKSLLYPTVKSISSINDYSNIPDIEETGSSFEENALIKAKKIASLTNKPTIADDSGLEVLSLNNEPGIYSARYAGINCSDRDNINKLLINLTNAKNRNAKFVCVIALIIPYQKDRLFYGECDGIITDNPSGDKGFGYDPVFLIPSLNKTFAELDLDEKNLYSHRAKAIEKLIFYLKNAK
jgi:XTP/dITP diphosphohydrolase